MPLNVTAHAVCVRLRKQSPGKVLALARPASVKTTDLEREAGSEMKLCSCNRCIASQSRVFHARLPSCRVRSVGQGPLHLFCSCRDSWGFPVIRQISVSLTPFSSPRNSFARLPIGGFAALGLALVPELLAFGQGKFELYSAVLKIHAGGDEGEPALLRLANQLADFLPVHQQLAGAQRSVVEDVAMLVGADVAVEQPEFAVFDEPIGIFKVGASSPDRFDLGSR